jgi:transcriptional regulator with XRE-family HTH domain
MTSLGQKVRELRLTREMTQLELATRAACTPSLVSALETGHSKYVTTRDIELLAKGLGLPEEDLWSVIPGGKSDKRYIAIGGEE